MRPHYDTRYVNQLIELAENNRCKGIIEEPRVMYGVVDLATAGLGISQFPNDTFINGDDFPMRFTHLLMAPLPVDDGDGGLSFADERFIQWVGARLRYHDTFYMNNQFVPAPNWVNKVIASGPGVTLGTSSWIFDRPAILSARDSLRVEFSLRVTPESARLVSASFTGVGLLSKRPYLLSSQLEVDNTGNQVFPASDFKNDGGEPIALTDMSVTVGPEEDSNDANGDVRLGTFQVKLLGNGTQGDWFQSDSSPLLVRAPAPILGVSTGRAVVHKFPGDGILLEPGDGLSAEAMALNSSVNGMRFTMAMAGYISVT